MSESLLVSGSGTVSCFSGRLVVVIRGLACGTDVSSDEGDDVGISGTLVASKKNGEC